MNKILIKAINENIQHMEPCYNLELFTDDLYNGNYVDLIGNAYNIFAERVKEVPLNTWMCTDTMVGLYAYFFDGQFVAISWKPYRKSAERLFWESEELAQWVKKFIDSLLQEEYNKPILIENIEDDVDACLTRLLNWKN